LEGSIVSNVPDGMSAMEWQMRQLTAREIAKQQARDDREAEREVEDQELRRRTAVHRVVSPLQSLVDEARAARNKKRGLIGRLLNWW
jgi:hypothetical protein